MRVLDLLDDGDVVELDVEVLVHALEGAAELDVVLELDGHLMVDEGLKEAREAVSRCPYIQTSSKILRKGAERCAHLKNSMAVAV